MGGGGEGVSLGSSGAQLVGRAVRKAFEDRRYYSGAVTSYDAEVEYWLITYEDGDVEEFDEADMRRWLVPEGGDSGGAEPEGPKKAWPRKRKAAGGTPPAPAEGAKAARAEAGGKAATLSPAPPADEPRPVAVALNDYERQRAENIARNQEKIRELMLSQLADPLKKQPAKVPRGAGGGGGGRDLSRAAAASSGPSRRSARVASKPAVEYGEEALWAAERAAEREYRRRQGGGISDRRAIGLGPEVGEVYTDADRAKLGTFTKAWDPDKVAWAEDGRRIYNHENAQTCHFCRQKILSIHSICREPGCPPANRHCGDCLWKRYGENVEEVNQDKSWRCPLCRDMCNCSGVNCQRAQKGWGPTGPIYPTAVRKGYPSAAHYLMHEFRAPEPDAPATPPAPGAAQGGAKGRAGAATGTVAEAFRQRKAAAAGGGGKK